MTRVGGIVGQGGRQADGLGLLTSVEELDEPRSSVSTMGAAVQFTDAVGYYCENVDYASDLTDAESDEEYGCVPRALERVVSRSSKRTYGACLDHGVVPERRLRCRVDEQLALLRAVIPVSCTDERASVLTGAYEYIESLQRQVQELHSELDTVSWSDDDDDESSCEDDCARPSCSDDDDRAGDSNSAFEWSCAGGRGRSRSRVEVVSNRAGLRVRVECEKSPGLLGEVMAVLEGRGLNVEEASVALEDRFVLDCFGTVGDRKHVVESRHVGSRLKALITKSHT